MSYILEALKKAQAERQLGNAPTIHAPQQVQVAGADGGGLAASRKPLLAGVGAGVIVAAVGAALLWQRAPAPGGSAAQVAAAPVVIAPAAAPALVAPASSSNAASATLAVRAPDAPPAPAPAAPRLPEARPATPPARPASVADARGAVVAPVTAPAPVQAQAAPASEDSLPLLQQLPDATRAQIPRVNFGGYMYSANPADRLVLVDKGLRHEGEEVGPGLVLEKLLPHAAVMNFRGIRYRVTY